MKSYYFISGLPRSGSTLLSSILRQNPEFYADIGSPIHNLIDVTIHTISSGEYNFTSDKHQRKNLMYKIFEGYYEHLDKSIIFDSSRLWSKKTNLLKELFPYTKILCPVRDIVSILNSFEVISAKNPFYVTEVQKYHDNVFSRCNSMMGTDGGIVIDPLISLKEGYALNPEMIMFVEYENLCKYPEKTMKEIYNFLEKPYYEHDFGNVEYSNEIFDKACNLEDLHTVRKRVEYNPPKNILPPEIVEEYGKMHLEFWRVSSSSYANFTKKFNNDFAKYQ